MFMEMLRNDSNKTSFQMAENIKENVHKKKSLGFVSNRRINRQAASSYQVAGT